MTRSGLVFLGYGALAGIAALLGSCEAIANIPERTQLTEPCERYCQLSTQLCTGTNQIFHGETDCANICGLYSSGELKCREGELAQLQQSKPSEAPAYCANASLSGGQNKCGGSPCENYCKAMGQVCGQDYPEPGVTYSGADGSDSAQCVKQCSVIPDREKMSRSSSESTYDVTKDHEGDTIQCRLVHLSLASTSDSFAKMHCAHAYINPQPIDQAVPFCSAPQGSKEPRCQDYCAVVMAACVDTSDEKHKVYESNSECLSACAAMTPGDLSMYQPNTVACRKYHAYNAAVLSNPTLHCPHAGPGGAGTCGDDCDSLCTLIEQGCSDQWQSKYGGSAKTCHDECDKARKGDPDYHAGGEYSVAAAKSGKLFACRLYHAAQSASQGNDNKDACDIAAGIKKCPFPSSQ